VNAPTDADVLVIGAGPVGLTLALALHRRGVAVRVLERRDALSQASRASTFHPPTLEALDELGVFAALRPGGVQVDRILWRRVDTGETATLDLGILRADTPFPFRWHREQHHLTQALADSLPRSAGEGRGGGATGEPPPTIHFNTPLDALSQTPTSVTAHTPTGPHTARYAVGCDGASGATRALLGIPAETADYAHRVLRVQTPLDLRDHIPGLDGVGYLHDARGSLSLLRMPGLWRLVFRLPPDTPDDAALAEDYARARIARFLPALRDMPVASRDVYGARKAMALSCRTGRVLLAGDAAHQTNTRGGMNMNAGIHDAMTLAAALHAVLHGADDALLDHWATARLAVARHALLPRTDARVAAAPGEEVTRMAALTRDAAHAWARENSMLDIAQAGAPSSPSPACWGGSGWGEAARAPTSHPPRHWHPTHRIGLLTPSANPAVEPELRHLLPGTAALHVARLPVMPGTTLEQRNAAYLAAAESGLAAFGALPLDLVIVGVTGPSYALPPAEDAALQHRLSETAGKQVILASRAIAEAFTALNLTRLLMVSPYPGWLTERAERYWAAAGLDLVTSVKLSDTFRAYDLTPEEVADGLARLAPPPDCAVLVSGTGAATLDAMEWARDRLGVPLLSSNLACAFAACSHLALPPGPAMTACCPALASRLEATAKQP